MALDCVSLFCLIYFSHLLLFWYKELKSLSSNNLNILEILLLWGIAAHRNWIEGGIEMELRCWGIEFLYDQAMGVLLIIVSVTVLCKLLFLIFKVTLFKLSNIFNWRIIYFCIWTVCVVLNQVMILFIHFNSFNDEVELHELMKWWLPQCFSTIAYVSSCIFPTLVPPLITFSLTPNTVNEGQNATAECKVNAANPAPNITIMDNINQDIPHVGGQATMSHRTRNQAGRYTCMATNGIGGVATVTANLTVYCEYDMSQLL